MLPRLAQSSRHLVEALSPFKVGPVALRRHRERVSSCEILLIQGFTLGRKPDALVASVAVSHGVIQEDFLD